jgi:hypothetical protein
VAGGLRRRLCKAVSGGCGGGCWTAPMMRAVAGRGALPNSGFNFRPNRPSGCGDTGIGGVGGLGGEYFAERRVLFVLVSVQML